MTSISKERICSFIESLYRDFGVFGCCVESPLAEPNVCYTSTNLLAEYVLRKVCSRHDLADKIKKFLNIYPTDFYDYYQILLQKPFQLPFTAVKNVHVDTLNGVKIVHVMRTDTVIHNYYDYANLVIYKTIYHMINNEKEKALEELSKLNKLFDGIGFADAYYREHRKYETYKLALAAILHKTYGHVNEVEKYVSLLHSINPLASLYESNFKGVGDLNLETANLVALALYTNITIKTSSKTTLMITPTILVPSNNEVEITIEITAIISIIAMLIASKSKKSSKQEKSNSTSSQNHHK